MHEVIPFGDSVSASTEPSLVRSDDELVKWRERVPKLASALRQRTEEVQMLRAELERLQPSPTAGAAGIRARDDLIRELEAKVVALAEQHKGAEGELHKRQLVIDELRGDLNAWKEKWQAVTRSLDEQALEVRDRDERVAALEQDNEALRGRNAQLLETTDLANRQVVSLTDSMVELRGLLQQQRELAAERDRASQNHARRADELQSALQASEAAREAAEAAREAAEAAREAAKAAREAAEADREAAKAAREAAEALLPELMEDLQVAYAGALAVAGAAADAAAVSAAVEACQDAETRLATAETQHAVALQQARSLEQRAGQLETQLEERSALVVTMEQDQRQRGEGLQQLQLERDEFEEAVLRAERNARESSAHVTQLNDKLERQQQLMEDLERELAEANEQVQGQARETDGGYQAEALRVQVRKLEALVRERTEALNQLQWQREMAAAPAAEQSGRSAAGKSASGAAADSKLLLVLNQQLEAARAENAQLLGRVRALQAGESGDDLTKIRGIGRKLAAQLNKLGIHRYQQIAELDDASLADQQHPLHAHRSRVSRDCWIQQAVALSRS